MKTKNQQSTVYISLVFVLMNNFRNILKYSCVLLAFLSLFAFVYNNTQSKFQMRNKICRIRFFFFCCIFGGRQNEYNFAGDLVNVALPMPFPNF